MTSLHEQPTGGQATTRSTRRWRVVTTKVLLWALTVLAMGAVWYPVIRFALVGH